MPRRDLETVTPGHRGAVVRTPRSLLSQLRPTERNTIINVCAICNGDGILRINALWFCKDHLDDAIDAVLQFAALHGVEFSDEELAVLFQPITQPKPKEAVTHDDAG